MKLPEPALLLISFVVYAAIFIPLETLIPHQKRSLLRPGWRTDLLHFFLNGLLRKVALAIIIVPLIYLLGFLIHPPLQVWVTSQPWWAQLVTALIIQEIGGYWGHRIAHKVPFLWRFHAVHHASENMDWLAATHLHPFDQAFIRAWAFIPLYLLGFSKETFGFFIVLEGINAIFIHANTRLRFGWLEQIIATPAFHHWHHTNDGPEYHDKNFAGLLPIMDRIFGTLHLPKDRLPESYGIPQKMPSTYLGQMLSPFRRRPRPSAEVAAQSDTPTKERMGDLS